MSDFSSNVGLATCLRDLLQVISGTTADEMSRADEILMTHLPTFGGDDPVATHGIFSWDATHLLVQDSGGFRIVPREEAT